MNKEEIDLFHSTGLSIRQRVIYLKQDEEDPEVNHNVAARCIKNLRILEQVDRYGSIEIIINSPGGNISDGLAIYDAICAFPGKVTGTVLGQASSMGSIILQACDIRRAYPNSEILLHDGNIELDGTIRDVKKQIEFTWEQCLRSYRIYADRSGRKPQYWYRKLATDYILTPEKALTEGLIDEII